MFSNVVFCWVKSFEFVEYRIVYNISVSIKNKQKQQQNRQACKRTYTNRVYTQLIQCCPFDGACEGNVEDGAIALVRQVSSGVAEFDRARETRRANAVERIFSLAPLPPLDVVRGSSLEDEFSTGKEQPALIFVDYSGLAEAATQEREELCGAFINCSALRMPSLRSCRWPRKAWGSWRGSWRRRTPIAWMQVWAPCTSASRRLGLLERVAV
jgi:hypothetical protein